MHVLIDDGQLSALRTSGILYFLIAITAPFGLLVVPETIFIPGDAAATAQKIRESEAFVRLGIGSELLHQAIAVFLVMALYRLFRPIDEKNAKLLVVLGALVSVPVMFLNVLNYIAAINLAGSAPVFSAFDRTELDALAYLFVRLHTKGIDIASVFWGLWLFPFGALALRSGFIPRIFGYLLFVAGTGYVAAAFTTLIVPQFDDSIAPIVFAMEIAEVPIVFWFLFRAVWPGRLMPSPGSS